MSQEELFTQVQRARREAEEENALQSHHSLLLFERFQAQPECFVGLTVVQFLRDRTKNRLHIDLLGDKLRTNFLVEAPLQEGSRSREYSKHRKVQHYVLRQERG